MMKLGVVFLVLRKDLYKSLAEIVYWIHQFLKRVIWERDGAAATGLRPIAELMFNDFIGSCLDQVLNQGAKFRYMFGGKAKVPVTVRTMHGAGFSAAAQHSQSLYALFTSIPGIKVVVPSTPYDAKGLLLAAIEDDLSSNLL